MPENDLTRFSNAQENSWNDALTEISRGRKQTHWMWFIFPQLKGLGISETSQFYGIKDLAEAEAYLAHPILGTRLIEICKILLAGNSANATEIFGKPDDMKLRSSMTLFAAVNNADPVFNKVLEKFFDGHKDDLTLHLLGQKKHA